MYWTQNARLKFQCATFWAIETWHFNAFVEQSVQVDGTEVDIILKVRNNQTLSMQSHVNAIAKICFHFLRNIARIRRILSEEECKIIVNTFVISRLYLCSSIWFTWENVTHLQNYAASLIMRFGRSEHITTVLRIFISSQWRWRWIIKFCFIPFYKAFI